MTADDYLEITKEHFAGMDGAAHIPKNVKACLATLETSALQSQPGDGVDMAIACAIRHARHFQDGRAGDVREAVRYIHAELGKFLANLSGLPEEPGALRIAE